MSEPIREVVISGGRVVGPAPRPAGDDRAEAPGKNPAPEGRGRFVAMNVFKRARFVVRAPDADKARAVLAPHDPCGALTLVEDPDGTIPAGEAPELLAADDPA